MATLMFNFTHRFHVVVMCSWKNRIKRLYVKQDRHFPFERRENNVLLLLEPRLFLVSTQSGWISLKIYKSIPYQCRIFIVRAIESFHVEHHLYQPFRDCCFNYVLYTIHWAKAKRGIFLETVFDFQCLKTALSGKIIGL